MRLDRSFFSLFSSSRQTGLPTQNIRLMPASLSTRRILLWFGVTVAIVVIGATAGLRVQQAKARHTPIAAYLVPIDNASVVKPAWWRSTRMSIPRPLPASERIQIPAGASVKLVRADSGVAELITGPAKLLLQQKLPAEPNFLISPLAEVIVAAQTNPVRPPESFSITSPIGKTRYLNPLITWTARDGVSYDVAVADAADPYVPMRKVLGARPPIALADLETPQRRQLGADRNYEIIIREANASTIAGVARFLTATDAQAENQLPTTPAELIAEAANAMAKRPTRAGDAWLALSRLPPDWAASELGVRLRLQVAVELGLPGELASALKDATKLNAP